MQSIVEGFLHVELEQYLEASRYERIDGRRGCRNGYYSRDLGTLYGAIFDLSAPRLREGSYDCQLFDHYQCRAGAIDQAIGTLFLNGISTRKLHWIAKELIGASVSLTAVSTIAAAITDEDIKQFQDTPLQDDCRFIFLDGISAKVKEIGVENKILLAAVGMKFDGTKEIVGARLSDEESEKDWEAFLIDLKTRGLTGKKLELITIDSRPGFIACLEDHLSLQETSAVHCSQDAEYCG